MRIALGFLSKAKNCSLFTSESLKFKDEEDGSSCFVKLSALESVSNSLKNSQRPATTPQEPTESNSMSDESSLETHESTNTGKVSYTSTYDDSTFETENTKPTTDTSSIDILSSSSTTAEITTSSETSSIDILSSSSTTAEVTTSLETETSTSGLETTETSSPNPSLPTQGSLLYSTESGDTFYCPDGSVLSALGYCTDTGRLCSGICMALNKTSDIELSADCETTQTCCQWESNGVFMSVTSFNESGTKGYDRKCCLLSNGWTINTGIMTEVRDHQDPQGNIQGDQSSVPDRWLICPSNYAIRYLDLDTTKGDYYIRAIKCYKVE
ncbi:hypothetical protein Avbf_03808 [Armadillidium vulgare]|nr:hypothetical protein Avbf_03808 [Armadillidium vulgare]